jgi:hypothetical protein
MEDPPPTAANWRRRVTRGSQRASSGHGRPVSIPRWTGLLTAAARSTAASQRCPHQVTCSSTAVIVAGSQRPDAWLVRIPAAFELALYFCCPCQAMRGRRLPGGPGVSVCWGAGRRLRRCGTRRLVSGRISLVPPPGWLSTGLPTPGDVRRANPMNVAAVQHLWKG